MNNSKNVFYSSLTEDDISEIDYTHPQRVFKHFNMTDLRDYHNFHLLIDALLLADVFENFRDVCLQHYGLDPAHNYTSPGLSWQAALKMTTIFRRGRDQGRDGNDQPPLRSSQRLWHGKLQCQQKR